MNSLQNKKIFILAGESSGDYIGSCIMSGIKKINKDIIFLGVGGQYMQKQGLDSIYQMNDFNIIGFVNTIIKFKKLKNYLNEIKNLILIEKPIAVITIDTKGFSLELAKKLKNIFLKSKFKCPLIHFVPPTIWAYGKYRIRKWRNLHDGLFCLFKNEENIFKNFNIRCLYVGNPIIESFLTFKNNNSLKSINKKKYSSSKVVNCLLLPGSRDNEIKYILPEFISLIKSSNKKLNNFNWIIPTTKLQYNNINSKIVKNNISNNTKVVILEENYRTLTQADLAVACSGTITLELVLFKVPTIAVYKTDFLSALIGRFLVDFKNVLLPNFILGANVIPLLFQEKCNHKLISNLLIDYITKIRREKKTYSKLSDKIINNMDYNQSTKIDFSENSSEEIMKIIRNYNY